MSGEIAELIPPGIIETTPEMAARLQQGKFFFEGVARDLANLKGIGKVDGDDFLLALLASNLGIRHDPIITNKPVAIGEDILQKDVIPFLPNSRLVFYIQVSGAATTINLVHKFGENEVVGTVLDGTPFATGVPREFNVPVSRDQKFNLRAVAATTIDLVKIIEFRIGL